MIEQPDYEKPGWCSACKSLSCGCFTKSNPTSLAAIARETAEKLLKDEWAEHFNTLPSGEDIDAEADRLSDAIQSACQRAVDAVLDDLVLAFDSVEVRESAMMPWNVIEATRSRWRTT